MLKTLLPLLRKGDTLGLSIGCEADAVADVPARFRVNVVPKLFTMDGDKGKDRLALNAPLSIVGTADELDSPEFAATLQRFATSSTELRHTIDEVEGAHKAAAAAKKATPPKPAPKAGNPLPKQSAKPAPKPAPKAVVKPGSKPVKPGSKKPSWQSRTKTVPGSARASRAPVDAPSTEPLRAPAQDPTPGTMAATAQEQSSMGTPPPLEETRLPVAIEDVQDHTGVEEHVEEAAPAAEAQAEAAPEPEPAAEPAAPENIEEAVPSLI